MKASNRATKASVGLITYMRTDSTRVSDDALDEVREFIAATYGPEYRARRAQRLQDQEGRAGRARSHPPHVRAARSGRRRAISRRKTN